MVKITRTNRRNIPSVALSYMPIKGENKRDIPSRIDFEQAEIIENYDITGDGRLITRKGLTKLYELTGDSMSMLKQIDGDTLVFAYDDGSNSKIGTYDISTGAIDIKNTFSTQGDVCGIDYYDFFYASDGTDKIGTFYKDGQFMTIDGTVTGNVFEGDTLTGATSGETATLKYTITYVDSYARGSGGKLDRTYIARIGFAVTDISGAFTDDEVINASSGGSFTLDGNLTDWYTIPQAPAAKILEIYTYAGKTCLFAGGLVEYTTTGTLTNDYKVRWSDYDVSAAKRSGDTNAFNGMYPFLTWKQEGTGAPDLGAPGDFDQRTGGKLNDIIAHKEALITVYDDTVDVRIFDKTPSTAGVWYTITSQKTQIKGFGGFKGVSTPFGVIYTSENGVFSYNISGFDQTEKELSDILGEEEIQDIDFSDSDIIYDGQSKIYIQCKKNVGYNNHTLVYDIDRKSWLEYTGWAIRRTVRISRGNTDAIYGVGSNNTNIYKLFDGYDDDGSSIYGRIRFRQETGDPTLIKNMKNLWAQGVVPSGSLIRININKWDSYNNAFENDKVYYWAGSSQDLTFGYGITGYGQTIEQGDTIIGENLVGKKYPIKDFLKYQIDITSAWKVKHELHFIETKIVNRRQRKLNNLTT